MRKFEFVMFESGLNALQAVELCVLCIGCRVGVLCNVLCIVFGEDRMWN